ncbi:haloacid dehalogenase, partial [Mycoplasmopsis pullorum]
MNNLKKQIKMIAFDIDGTILPNGKTVFDHRVVQMFDELREQGILTVLA